MTGFCLERQAAHRKVSISLAELQQALEKLTV